MYNLVEDQHFLGFYGSSGALIARETSGLRQDVVLLKQFKYKSLPSLPRSHASRNFVRIALAAKTVKFEDIQEVSNSCFSDSNLDFVKVASTVKKMYNLMKGITAKFVVILLNLMLF